MKTYMVDVDGVLAQFNIAFLRLLEKVSAKRSGLPDDWEPTEWEWMQRVGYGPSFQRLAWENVDHMFWMSLKPYEWTRGVLMELNFRAWGGDPVYFVTSRPGGGTALAATADWLSAYGIFRPNVIVVPPDGNKGDIAKAIHADVVIDDKPQNLESVCTQYTHADLWLVDRPWNQGPFGSMTRVKDLYQALAIKALEVVE